MSVYALELNDAEFVALDDSRELLRDSGFAARDGSSWKFGAAAAARARLFPQAVFTAQFATLGASSLKGTPLAPADLVYEQLRGWSALLGRERGIWLASPAAGPEELGLLLGIADAAGLNIAILADRAVALAASLPFEGSVHCIDVELERAVISELRLENGTAAHRNVFLLEEMGLRALYDTWMRGFAARMVQATRFDPLHTAVSEQALFDALPGWLETLAKGSAIEDAAISGPQSRYSIPFRPAEAALDAASHYRRLNARLHAQGDGAGRRALLLSATAARLPGLLQSLDEFRDASVFVAPPGKAAAAALGALAIHIEDGTAAVFLRSLPQCPDDAWQCAREPVSALDAPAPTHLVYAGRAVALSHEPLLIGANPGQARVLSVEPINGVSRAHCSVSIEAGHAFVLDHSRYGSFVNGERVFRRSPVRVGDRLRLGNPGIELGFVRLD